MPPGATPVGWQGVTARCTVATLTRLPKPIALAAVSPRLPLLVLACCAAVTCWACRKDDPAPTIAQPTLAPVPPSLVTAPGDKLAPEADEEEAPPAGPAVEVNVAADPAQPLAWYRGPSTERGHENAQWFSRKAAARKPVAVEDGAVALRGTDKPNGVRKGPVQLTGERPLLISIGAKWCKPCGEELGDVFELAKQIRGDVVGEDQALLFILEGTPDEWPMAEVRDELLAKHAKSHKLAKPLTVPPWAEFRADIDSSWGELIKQLGVLGGGTVALPVNLLLDKCGHVQAAATGSLDAAKKAAFLAQVTKLAAVNCVAAPILMPPPVPRPAMAAKPRPPDAKGDDKGAAAGPGDPKTSDDKVAPDDKDRPEGLKLDPKEAPAKEEPKAAAKDEAKLAPKDDPKASAAEDGKRPSQDAPKPAAKDEPKAAAKDEKAKDDKPKVDQPKGDGK